MGIQNLLKELRPITKTVNLSQFSGQKCGVDASCWLHRSSHSCALDLVSGKATNKYLRFTLRCLETLLHFNITPIIVFDGARLPMKANEEHRRNQIREDNKKQAIKCLKAGNREQAWKHAQSAVRITKQMVTGFINQCIKKNVEYICAPYEADSQLGYMYKTNYIDFVITEDSDLLLFGVQKALYKFNPGEQTGDYINMNDIKNYKCKKNMSNKKKKMDLCLFLRRFGMNNPKEFIRVCVLSGCDYVKNLTGIGIKTAVRYCFENRKIDYLLHNVMSEKFQTAPKDYKIQFKRAVLTFLHQRVYDMNSKKLVHLNPLTSDVDTYLLQLTKYLSRGKDRTQVDNGQNPNVCDTSLDFLGKEIDDNIAVQIAEGRVDARSLQTRNLVSRNNDDNNNNVVNDNDDSNRFFAAPAAHVSVATVASTSDSNGGGTGVISEGLRRKKKKGSYGMKDKKYFGALDNDVVEMECEDGLEQNGKLDGLMTQFGYGNTNNNSNNRNNYDSCNDFDDDMNWGNTENNSLEMDEKDTNESNILVEDSDIENENEINYNKPLKRMNRKRKRDVMNELSQNRTVEKNYRRKLNNGNINTPNVNNRNINKRRTPQNNIMQTPVNRNRNNDSIISDLLCTNNKNREYNINENNEEYIGKKSNQKNTPHNPFSLKKQRKNNNMSNRKAIAMIGDECKPIELSDSESGNESDNYVNKNMNIYNNFDDNINENNNERIYSQLSQSQSEQQMDDIMKDFQNQMSQSQSQRSDEIKEQNDNIGSGGEEDDDIQIICNVKKNDIKKFTPPKFKKPKFTKALPIINRNKKKVSENNNSKKKNNMKNNNSKVKTKGKKNKKTNVVGSKQKTLHSFFFKKIDKTK